MSDGYPGFSFCETSAASARSMWHLRVLTEVGRKLGGGADTPALCGAQVSWDLMPPLNSLHLRKSTCGRCLIALMAGSSTTAPEWWVDAVKLLKTTEDKS